MNSDAPAPSISPSSSIHGAYLGDALLALRRLGKARGFALAVILTLGLCIGANALIFSMLYTLVLRPLPFRHASALVEISNSYTKSGLTNYPGNVAQYIDYAKLSDVFEGVGLYRVFSVTVGEENGALRSDIARVTPGFFELLGVHPLIGQFFEPSASTSGADRLLVLTESFWSSHFHSDSSVVGRQLLIDEIPYTIVGVAPRAVEALAPSVGLLKPLSWRPQALEEMNRQTKEFSYMGRLLARLRPGVSLAQAQAKIAAADRAFYSSASAPYQRLVDESGHISTLQGLQDAQTGSQRKTFYLLQAAAVFVLLIGCINVTNLLLARVQSRQTEFALRAALGSSRMAIARQVLVEALVLSLAGGALAFLVSVGGIELANTFGRSLLPVGAQFHVDGSILASSLILAIAMGLLIAILPMLHATGRSLESELRASSRSSSGTRASRRFAAILIVGQVALSLMLLIATGLMIQSLLRASAVEAGFDRLQVVTARVSIPPRRFREFTQVTQLQERLLATLREIPGVDVVGLGSNTPMADRSNYQVASLFLDTMDARATLARPTVQLIGVSPDYFTALGIRVWGGRVFNDADNSESARSVVIDRRLATRFFGNQEALGKHVAFERPPTKPDDWLTVVGVVETVRYGGLDDTRDVPFAYLPIQRLPSIGNSFFLRTRRPGEVVLEEVRRRIASVDTGLPVFLAGGMDAIVESSLDNRRAVLVLLGVFAGLAALLAAIGLYSVLAYDVSRRTREIGLRAAIGADRRQILLLFLREGSIKTAFGIGVGLVGSVLLARAVRGLLFGVTPNDPLTLTLSIFLLGLVGAVASLLPSFRAARINPVAALRAE